MINMPLSKKKLPKNQKLKAILFLILSFIRFQSFG